MRAWWPFSAALDFVEQPEKYLKAAAVVLDVFPDASGKVKSVDTRGIGIGIVEMGGGRSKPTDNVDHAVGLTNIAGLGEEVGKGGRPLATVHAHDEASFEKMAQTLKNVMKVSAVAAQEGDIIRQRIAA